MDQGLICIRDRPAPFWALGIFLLAGGVLAIAMALGLATNADELEPWERLASIVVGLGVCAGALWWLARSPGTEVQLDRTHQVLRIMSWGLRGRQLHEFRFDGLESAFVDEGEDNDGGTVWRPAVRLRSGGVVLLSELWSHDQTRVRMVVATVADACRIPSERR